MNFAISVPEYTISLLEFYTWCSGLYSEGAHIEKILQPEIWLVLMIVSQVFSNE